MIDYVVILPKKKRIFLKQQMITIFSSSSSAKIQTKLVNLKNFSKIFRNLSKIIKFVIFVVHYLKIFA